MSHPRSKFDRLAAPVGSAIGDPEFQEPVEAAFQKYAGLDYADQWENLERAPERFESSWEKFREGYHDARFEDEDNAYHAIPGSLLERIGDHVREHFDSYIDEAGSDLFASSAAPPKIEHPLGRRLNWHPLVVAIPFLYLWSSSYTRDFPLWRTLAACFVSVWFAVSLKDYFSDHALLDWMYAEDEDED